MKFKLSAYKGKNIIVTFDPKRCTHVAKCIHELPQVFATIRKPWILPDAAPANRISRVVQMCPTGALHYQRTEGGTQEPTPERNTITVSYNGPLYIYGDIEVIDAKGEKLKNTRMALCRCGKSKNQPLCDGAHYQTSFRDSGIILSHNRRQIKQEQDSSGLLINADRKGPLKMTGPMVILSSKDEVGFTGTTAILCGCGRSKNTPFCDGSHPY